MSDADQRGGTPAWDRLRPQRGDVLLFVLLASMLPAACDQTSHVGPSAPSGPEVVQAPGHPPVATSPEGILSHDAVRTLQSALVSEGIGVESTGVLDDQTQAAIRKFQHRHRLAETGLPTMQTLRLLGLDAARIYAAPSRAAHRPNRDTRPPCENGVSRDECQQSERFRAP